MTALTDAAAEPGPARRLYNYFATSYRLVNSGGRAYAVPSPDYPQAGTPGVAQPLDGSFRHQIVRRARHLEGVPKMVGRADVDKVMDNLKADAMQARPVDLALRVAQRTGTVVLDLAPHHRENQLGDLLHKPPEQPAALQITADGWTTCAIDGPTFRRSHATQPLPVPERGGRLDVLAQILALDPTGEPFRALAGWLVGLAFTGSVRPGVLMVGPPGTGKSTRLRLVASVIEPSGTEALGASFGHNFGDDHVRALHRAVPLWDNLTNISGTGSDAVCTMITGTARETRQLYSDNELNAVPIARPLGLTAVGVPAGLRPDALDRLLVVDTPRIAHRADDLAIQHVFDELHPMLLGAWADCVSAVLRWRDRTPTSGTHRLAAHARILAALDAATAAGELTGAPAGMLDAFAATQRRTRERTVADDVFGGALLSLLEARGGTWRGKASDLLIQAAPYSAGGLSDLRAPGWPASPRKVPEVLGHLTAGLLDLGVSHRPSIVRGSRIYEFTTHQEG